MTDYALVMPFVVVESRGGPFDDSSYVAGWEAGVFDAALSLRRVSTPWRLPHPVREENRAQLDLIAMRHGFTAEFQSAGDGWEYVTVERLSAIEDEP